jgi:heparan-alpha-glucosaminide N-acetyltransferase
MRDSAIVSSSESASAPASPRLASIDAYRGFVMFLMLAEVLQFCAVAKAVPDSRFWAALCRQQSHAAWEGCSLHDLIQPGFCFLVGVALVLSLAKRRTRGQTRKDLLRHAVARSGILVLLGIGIASVGPRQINWTFFDTLAQIGLSYGFAFLLCGRPARDWWIAFGVILVGYWLAFVLYPLPAPTFDYGAVGVSSEWLTQNGVKGFAAHWQKNSHIASAFDIWFLNLFPQPKPFLYQPNGLATLNFIPTIATMILGLFAGRVLQSNRLPGAKVKWLAVAGGVGLCSGLLLSGLGVCPVVKSIWTPSWVLFSGGWCFLLTATWYLLVDIWGLRWIAFPFIVVGSNSIAAYCGSKLYSAFAFNAPKRILGSSAFQVFGNSYEPLLLGGVILCGFWVTLFILYRKKVFLRI